MSDLPPLPDELRKLADAVTARPEVPAAACVRGLSLLMDREYDRARAEFEAALRDDPDNPVALEGLGDALLRLGRGDEAVARYREAAAKDPGGGVGLSATRKAGTVGRGRAVRVFGETGGGGCLAACVLLAAGAGALAAFLA